MAGGKNRVEASAYKVPRHLGETVAVFLDKFEGQRAFTAKPLEFRERKAFEGDSDPAFFLNEAMAQKLMDDLWTCGLRPSEGTGSAGAMAACQEHLKDLREVVSKSMTMLDKSIIREVIKDREVYNITE